MINGHAHWGVKTGLLYVVPLYRKYLDSLLTVPQLCNYGDHLYGYCVVHST